MRTLKTFEEFIMPIPECGCWIWMGANKGAKQEYGDFRHRLAHRVSWELYNGLIPKGLQVLHNCNTSLCVNPRHLRLGTQKENIQDAIKAKRRWNNKGENHPLHKLSCKDIKAIRADNRFQREIAADYKICGPHVSMIKNYKVWKIVEG